MEEGLEQDDLLKSLNILSPGLAPSDCLRRGEQQDKCSDLALNGFLESYNLWLVISWDFEWIAFSGGDVQSRGQAVFSTDLLNKEGTDNSCIALFFQIGLDTSYWTVVNQFFIWGSLSVYFAITFTMYSDGMYLIFTASFPFIGKPWDKSGLHSERTHCRA